MKKFLTLAACSLLVLSGCGDGGSSSSDGVLKVGVGGDFSQLDPAKADDSITANVLNQTYEGLYTLDTNGNAVPNLATADAEVSEDGLTYTITLKDGEIGRASCRERV